ncbi:MAG: hypothetical protein ABI822_18955 [Bryobacteraceae bacterium]
MDSEESHTIDMTASTDRMSQTPDIREFLVVRLVRGSQRPASLHPSVNALNVSDFEIKDLKGEFNEKEVILWNFNGGKESEYEDHDKDQHLSATRGGDFFNSGAPQTGSGSEIRTFQRFVPRD